MQLPMCIVQYMRPTCIISILHLVQQTVLCSVWYVHVYDFLFGSGVPDTSMVVVLAANYTRALDIKQNQLDPARDPAVSGQQKRGTRCDTQEACQIGGSAVDHMVRTWAASEVLLELQCLAACERGTGTCNCTVSTVLSCMGVLGAAGDRACDC